MHFDKGTQGSTKDELTAVGRLPGPFPCSVCSCHCPSRTAARLQVTRKLMPGGHRRRSTAWDNAPNEWTIGPSDKERPKTGINELVLEDAPHLFQDKRFDLANILEHLLSISLVTDLALHLDVLQKPANAGPADAL